MVFLEICLNRPRSSGQPPSDAPAPSLQELFNTLAKRPSQRPLNPPYPPSSGSARHPGRPGGKDSPASPVFPPASASRYRASPSCSSRCTCRPPRNTLPAVLNTGFSHRPPPEPIPIALPRLPADLTQRPASVEQLAVGVSAARPESREGAIQCHR
ncbi:hypothetical protein B2J93_319 [Marssonina coronariae]|uniref:Uncharacterized protein n=1 Tax=Diplocarpon coronariae TaxID=2795749 RepID=A0A218Z0G2_9HELO|nr:hypothetical protein B2J93_319 [Marssonina coronariae]